ncbi:MAG: MarR family transcriptional regulator, partial [Woeseiaceae bacterium]|nr:MarR family transcriptional regulator [Woeseiaceae bacterium]
MRSKEAIRTWLRLLSCEMVIEQQLRSLFRNHFSVTLPQYDALSELERAGKQLTMSELSKELMVSNGNVTGIVDRLEKSGLV